MTRTLYKYRLVVHNLFDYSGVTEVLFYNILEDSVTDVVEYLFVMRNMFFHSSSL